MRCEWVKRDHERKIKTFIEYICDPNPPVGSVLSDDQKKYVIRHEKRRLSKQLTWWKKKEATAISAVTEWASKTAVTLNDEDIALIAAFASWLRPGQNTGHKWPLGRILIEAVEVMISYGAIDAARPRQDGPSIGEIMERGPRHFLPGFVRLSGYLISGCENRGAILNTIHLGRRSFPASSLVKKAHCSI
jgi:hypothetical protein